MCTSPILIRNRKFRDIQVNFPNKFIKVPCGVCDECLRKRAKDLYIRARYEAERCIMNGGCGFMCCLTYDNSLLPFLEYEGRKYMVFNKKDVILFIKRLRIHLDRFYMKSYGVLSPDFKYLVTSEFGTDPTKTKRPHYHLIILFNRSVGYVTFRSAFCKSLINSKTGKRYFGKIFQCDPLDIKRGGIRYSSKYILKDQTYNRQNIIIKEHINFYTHYVNSKYCIKEFCETEKDYFYNKCIRGNKDYKKDVSAFIGKYRDMLQFYLCSNDFGCSAICDRYGQNLYTLGLLNLDGLPYTIPKQVIERLARLEGSDKKDIIAKSVFQKQFKDNLDNYPDMSLSEKNELNYFVTNFIQPRYGSLYFISPSGISFYNSITESPLRNYDELFEEFNFFDDNNFFELRNKVLNVMNYSNRPSALEFRAKLAYDKTCTERMRYEQKKRNNPSNY